MIIIRLNCNFIYKFKIYTIISVIVFFLSTHSGGQIYYNFEDVSCPEFIPNCYNISGYESNSFVQFGYPIHNNGKEIKLKLDKEARVSFRWHHDTEDGAGALVFLARGLENPIECHSKGMGLIWEEIGPIDVSSGEIKWLLTRLSDIGYLDDLKIQYKGCRVLEFNIGPQDYYMKNKTITIKLSNEEIVCSAQLEIEIPGDTSIDDYSTSGFFSEAIIKQRENMVTINQTGNSIKVNEAEIKLWLSKIPHGRHSIKITQIIINGITQHPSLFNNKWTIESNDIGVSVINGN